ncbi:PAS domain S-box protein [uncultured Methanoregula sp.]|uniref:response regulator n=1 Tax=uncultured Methanoregula sp. TaxID=1005933 RepID=UPI002AABB704|nr:PAS domain S-box protein [uncultured Methanoregula sp.]
MEEGIQVLYVDDEPDLLEIARLFLESTGNFHVSTSISAKQSLDSPQIRSYDAIISDYQMPGMDGIAFLKEVRNRFGDIPFILFTGRGREEVVIQAINNGADFYLQKGGDPTAQFAELAHKIRQAVLRKRAELSRIKAELDLRESEERYRNVIANAPYGMHFYEQKPGRGLVFTGANPGADRILGVSHDQFIGKTLEEAFPGLAGTEVPERYREAAESGRIWQTEQVKYGEGLISGAFAVTAFRTAPGAMAAMFVDITSRKKADEELRESEERSRRILEQAPLPLAHVNNAGAFTFLNDRFVRVFGYTAEDIPTLETWWERAYPDPDYRKRVIQQWMDAVRRSGEEHTDIRPAEYRVTCKNGEERIIEISGITLIDGFLATFVDNTERRRTEEALLQKTEELDQYFSASIDLFCIAGTDGYFRRLNKEWEKTLGYTLAELEGHRFLDFVHPDDLASTLAAVSDLSHRKQVVNFTNRYRHKDGSYRWVEWRSFPSGDRIFAAARDITERKHIDEALRESEERLRLFIQHAPAALAMFDREMRYLAASHRWMADYHLGDRDILGSSHYEIFPEITGELKAIHNRGLSGEVVSADEEKFERQDGSVQWLAWEVRPWYTTGNAVGGIIIFSEDITRRKKADEALRESEAQLTSILHGSPVLQFVIDHEHRILSWNKALEEYSGIRAADVIGTDQQWRAFYPDPRPVLADLLVDNNEDGLFKWYSGKLQPSRYVDGAYEATDFFPDMGESGTWLSFTAAPIRNAEGTIIGAVETLEDVTERITVTEALRTSEEKYRRILENMQDAYIRTDENGNISMVNRSAARLYGYGSAEEMCGISAVSLYAISGQRDGVIRDLQKSGGVTDFAGVALRKDGTTFQASLNVQFIRDEEDRVLGTEGIVRDITERKSMEHAIREANRKLNLLNSITRHDIVNQLTMLQGFTQVAAMKESDPVIAEYLSKIDAGSSTIRRQIEFMKTYQELGVHTPGWSRLDKIVAKAGREEVVFFATCEDTEIFSDPMLEKVFFNLFENAIGHGEHVTEITVRCERAQNELIIIVEDNGVGIMDGEKEKIFEKGFGKNSGLGLFLAKEILSITGLTIRESGIPGKGAKFEIVVPKGHFRSSHEKGTL